jgi:hypothetical protein
MNFKYVRNISFLLLALAPVELIGVTFFYTLTKYQAFRSGGAFLFVGTFISGIALLLFSNYLEKKSRTKLFKNISEQTGWNFEPQPENVKSLKSFPESLIKAEFLENILKGKTRNLLTGKMQDSDFAVFDQYYVDGFGEEKHQRRITLFVLNSKQLRLPIFCCEPNGFVYKLVNFFLKKAVMFENYPKFSQKYQLYGPNEIAIRQTFNFEVLSYFQQQAPLTIIGAENYLIVYKPDYMCPPEEIFERINKTVEIANLF